MSRSARLLILSLAVCWHLLAIMTIWPKAMNTHQGRDFASYYYAAVVVAEGGDPYDRGALEVAAKADRTRLMVYPYLYPPPFLFTVSWAPWFSLKTAYLSWFWFNEVAFAVMVAALARWWRALPHHPVITIFVVGALLSAVPSNHFMGQANLPVMALTIAALWLADEDRPWWGGVLMGLAVVFKGMPVILVLWWLLRRKWKAVGVTAGTAAVALGASVLVYGWQPMHSFLFDVLPSMRSGYYNNLGLPVHLFTNHSIPDLVHQVLLDRGPLLSTASQIVSTVISLTLLAFLTWAFRRAPRDHLARYAQPAALMVVALLLPTFTYEHHVVWAIPAAVLGVSAVATGRLPLVWAFMVGMAIATWAFPLRPLMVLAEMYEPFPPTKLVHEFKSLALIVLAGSMVRLQWPP